METNDHPIPGQFLITEDYWSFYNIAPPSKSRTPYHRRKNVGVFRTLHDPISLETPYHRRNDILDTSSRSTNNTATFILQDIIEDVLEARDIDSAGSGIHSAIGNAQQLCGRASGLLCILLPIWLGSLEKEKVVLGECVHQKWQ